jgi:2',3'-cyclic-nucleotide 2'-phosphodiesterase/3'-nucleotidase
MDTLTLLVTADTHGGMHAAGDGCALPRLASALAAARRGRTALLLDNGDTLFGGPLVDHLAHLPPERNTVAACFAAMGYDALNIGNEDLQLGVQRIEALARAHSLPLVATNMVRPGQSPILPHRMLSVALASGLTVKVGIVGTVPASACHGFGLPPIQPARASLAQAVARLVDEGCDVIVGLCHSGIEGGRHFPSEEAEALALASVPGVSIVVAGHLHELEVRWTSGGVPVVAPGSHGRHFGLVEVDFRGHGQRAAKPTHTRVRIEASDASPPEPAIRRLLDPSIEAMNAQGDTILGARTAPLTTDFAPLAKPSALRWMETCLRARVSDVTGRQDIIVTTQCAGGRGPLAWETIPAGAVRRRDLASLFPYRNALYLAEVQGVTLLAWLEASTAIFRRIDPHGEALQPLLDEQMPLCDHDYFSDLSYAVDLCKPIGSRVVGAVWRGQPIEPAGDYLVALNSYRMARLARGSPLRNRGRMARSVGDVFAAGFRAQAPADGDERRLLPLPSRLTPHFRARASATTEPPPGIRRMQGHGPDSGAVYTLEWTG